MQQDFTFGSCADYKRDVNLSLEGSDLLQQQQAVCAQ